MAVLLKHVPKSAAVSRHTTQQRGLFGASIFLVGRKPYALSDAVGGYSHGTSAPRMYTKSTAVTASVRVSRALVARSCEKLLILLLKRLSCEKLFIVHVALVASRALTRRKRKIRLGHHTPSDEFPINSYV